jgi:hypothetical protein
MPSLTKRHRSRLRELASRAHARALAQALSTLREELERWGGDENMAFELNDVVHTFHNGISRELYSKYVTAPPELAVFDALRNGVLRPDEVDAELVAAIGMGVEDLQVASGAKSAKP